MIKTYEPLHHKYRPTTFDELVGQDPITSTLKQALTSNRIAPAYIFSGPRGTGKTSSARIFAKSLNCLRSEQATTLPCGKCELCKGINSGNALDVIEIDAASNTGVENIRELIERSRFAPAKARWKVYVIDECHMLSTAAFNALLKTLEEPPRQVVFILATTDPQRVLPTILSRCMRFDFRRIGLNDLKSHLISIAKKEEIQINEEAISLIAKHSQGGLRDAESLLDQVSLLPPPITQANITNLIGSVPEEELIKLAKSLTNKDPNSILYISRAMDYFDLSRQFKGGLVEAFKNQQTKFLVISFSSDWLYTTRENKDTVIALNAAGADVSFAEIKTDKGHDSFLVNEPEFLKTVKGFIDSMYIKFKNEKRI